MKMIVPEEVLSQVQSESINIPEVRQSTYTEVSAVDHLHGPISYAEFLTKYLLPNRACILGSWATEGWRSRQDWIAETRSPNLDHFSEMFGDAACCVANCGLEEYNTHPKTDMTIKEYIAYLHQYKGQGYPPDMECLYLKDWHFTRLFPDYEAYSVPVYFASDWLNEYWDSRSDQSDDYRFVYFGPKGSWTSFHSDVFRSYSWSANIVGCKKWVFFPPGEEDDLRDTLGNLAYDLDSPELKNKKKFPNADMVKKRFEVYQRSGEVIFVPSGWHHQVYNLEDTISINHNWLNGCNIDLAWLHIKQSLGDVQREIEDCKDMEGWAAQCQLILSCNSGIDFSEFYRFMCIIAQKRLSLLSQNSLETTASSYTDLTEPSVGGSYIDFSSDKHEKTVSLMEETSGGKTCNGKVTQHQDSTGRGIPKIQMYHSSTNQNKLSEINAEEQLSPNEQSSKKYVTQVPNCDRKNPASKLRDFQAVPYYNNIEISHVIFDLCRIKLILKDMLTTKEFVELDFSQLPMHPSVLLVDIEKALSSSEELAS